MKIFLNEYAHHVCWQIQPNSCTKSVFGEKNIVEVIHSMSRLENINTTFPQSKTMIDGMSVSGISTHDMQVLLNLKNAWQFILSSDSQFDLAFACKVNGFVAYNESLAWGELRTGNVCISGVSFVPDILLKTRLNKR